MTTINSKALLSDDSFKAPVETNDCVIYAIATAFDLDYDSAHKEVSNRMNRKPLSGVRRSDIIKALPEGTTINTKTVTEVIKSPQKMYKVYGNFIPRKNRLSTFVKQNGQGTFLLILRGHAITLKEGVIMNNKRETKPGVIVEVAFRIE